MKLKNIKRGDRVVGKKGSWKGFQGCVVKIDKTLKYSVTVIFFSRSHWGPINMKPKELKHWVQKEIVL